MKANIENCALASMVKSRKTKKLNGISMTAKFRRNDHGSTIDQISNPKPQRASAFVSLLPLSSVIACGWLAIIVLLFNSSSEIGGSI